MPTSRPPLPSRHANPNLKQLESGPLPPVKYQILNCQGKDILVGRMKIITPTASGHAFILRRYDTGAVSLTTMFRAAFPSATELDEKRETTWIRDNYDLSGYNGSSKDVSTVRLAGIWVSPRIALELAESYSMPHIIVAITNATPDPNGNYRRSGKTGNNNSSPKASPTPALPPVKSLPSPPTQQPNPPKRRKEGSPGRTAGPTSTGGVSAGATGPSSPPRRSTRLKSPTPKPPSTRQSTRAAKTRVEHVVVADTSIETIAEDAEAMNVASQDLHAQDMAEQQAMIADLKAQRDEAAKEDEWKLKRTREEEEQMRFEFKEPGEELGERVIATNRKVSRFAMEPRTKSVAWGVAAFAFGLGAVSFLPNFM